MNRFEHKLYATLIFILLYWFFVNSYSELRLAFWPSLFMVILGSHFPDFDLDFGIRFHRSPITHSPLIPGIIFIGYLFSSTPVWILEIMAWFIIGYSTHLFFDLAPSGWGLLGFVISAFNPAESPGDIRQIAESLEKPFLILGGIVCVLMAIIMLFLARNLILFPFLPVSGSLV